MKTALLAVLERLGYVLVHADVWRSVQRQASGAAAPANGPPPQQIARFAIQIQSLERERDRLAAELNNCRDRLAAADPSGRIQALEAENKHLSQRLADLEVYLKETRGSGGASYL